MKPVSIEWPNGMMLVFRAHGESGFAIEVHSCPSVRPVETSTLRSSIFLRPSDADELMKALTFWRLTPQEGQDW